MSQVDQRAQIQEALEIGLDLARAEFLNVSEALRGYLPAKHDAAAADVAKIEAALVQWQAALSVAPLELAKRFHEAYERLAPSFGYETRAETRVFDPESANGKLMIAVCAALHPSEAAHSKPVAPWPDFLGQPIRQGDQIVHPDGNEGTVLYWRGEAETSDKWRVAYEDGTISRLCLQTGDKGRAVLAYARAALEAHLSQSVEPVAPTQEQSNSAFEMAMRESWRMVDPFKPAGEPGSYARGQDSGIVAALQTVRNNYERALKAAPQPPIQPAFLSENEQAILQQALKRSAHVLDDQAVQPSHAAVCLTKPVVAEAMLDKLLASLCLDEEGLPDYDSLAEFDLRQAMRRAQPSNDKPSEPNIPLNAAAQAPDAATPGGAPHLRTPDAAAPDVRARAETLKQMVGDYWDLAYIEGKEGRDVDTTDGAAARKWHAILKAIDALSASQVERATSDVIAERQRQIEREGWTPEHDDRHPMDVIARAAAAYALAGSSEGRVVGDELEPSLITRVWPWSQQWWKPTTPRRNLVKAGALILAAIARYDRAALSASQGSTT